MQHLIPHALRVFLDAIGIDDKQQFMLLVITGLAILVVYFVRDRHQHGVVFTMLFTTLCLAGLVFLFTQSEATRDWSALIGMLSIVAIFSWEFIRRRRAAALSASDDDSSRGETSAAAGNR
jgi:hypothetical protein